MSEEKYEFIYCNQCKEKKRHLCEYSVKRSGSSNSVDWSEVTNILVCGGCDHITLQSRMHFSEYQYDPGDLDPDPEYLPLPMSRIAPDWSITLSDLTIRSVLKELYTAFNSDLYYLSAVAARTVFDLVLVKHVGDCGGFEEKLKKFKSDGHVSLEEKKHLDVLTEAGNAAAHRGHALQKVELSTIIDILENLLHKLYVKPEKTAKLSRDTEDLKKRIPQRKRKPEITK